jgi:diaminopropionate ammonia-lyase
VSQYVFNRFRKPVPSFEETIQSEFSDAEILSLHRSLPGYTPTPLVSLPALAAKLDLKNLLVKDESHRLGLKAFKVLGASYAIFRSLSRHIEKTEGLALSSRFSELKEKIPPGSYTFCTATDGNHGRGVAWVAAQLGQRSAIYMPRNTVAARINAIAELGAKVIVIDGDYDEAVEIAASDANANDWLVISDTSWSGYREIPLWIMAGYTTLFREIHEQQLEGAAPDLVIIPAGVGALACTAAWHYSKPPFLQQTKLISVEPEAAACHYESIMAGSGDPVRSAGSLDSIMAGLNCGIPSPVAWPAIRDRFDLFMTITDNNCITAMNTYFHPVGDDQQIISGESGAATLAALLVLREMPADLKTKIGLDQTATVLLINTEGDTDPVQFASITGSG